MHKISKLLALLLICNVVAWGQTRPDWLQIKGNPVIQAAEYGHGVTKSATVNDAAIASACAALPDGGTIQLGRGTFAHNKIVVGNKIMLRGAGEFATILQLPAGSKALIDANAELGIYPDDAVDWFGVADLTYDGSCQNNSDWGAGSANWGVNDYNTISAHGVVAASLSGTAPKDFLFENVRSINCIRNNFLVGNNTLSAEFDNSGRIINCSAINSQADHLLYVSSPRPTIISGFIGEGYWRGAAVVTYAQDFSNTIIRKVTENPTVYDTTTIFDLRGSENNIARQGFRISGADIAFKPSLHSRIFSFYDTKNYNYGGIIEGVKLTQQDADTVSSAILAVDLNASDTVGLTIRGIRINNLSCPFQIFNGSSATASGLTKNWVFEDIGLEYLDTSIAGASPLFRFNKSISTLTARDIRANWCAGLGMVLSAPASCTFTGITFDCCKIVGTSTAALLNLQVGPTYASNLVTNSHITNLSPNGSYEEFRYNECEFILSGQTYFSERQFIITGSGASTTMSLAHQLPPKTAGTYAIQATPLNTFTPFYVGATSATATVQFSIASDTAPSIAIDIRLTPRN